MAPETRSQLLTAAERIVRRHGYAGFSYADLADSVGIRKASIHHHFPTKEDLGLALVEAYTDRIDAALADLSAREASAPRRLDGFAAVYRDALESGQGCLCGVLASELAGLPTRMRAGIATFFAHSVDWLTHVLRAGQDEGAIRTDQTPSALANAVLAAMQGALLLGQAHGSVAAFDAAVAATLSGLEAQKPMQGRARRSP